MIYLDTSVLLAHLLDEEREPAPELWAESLVTSRLLEYEARNFLRRQGLVDSHGDALDAAFRRLAFIEMIHPILEGVGHSAPGALRTLDAIHIASMHFLTEQGVRLRMASYDPRLRAAAAEMGVNTVDDLL